MWLSHDPAWAVVSAYGDVCMHVCMRAFVCVWDAATPVTDKIGGTSVDHTRQIYQTLFQLPCVLSRSL